MYKLLIADDEKFIREGMRSIVDWNSLGITEIITAPDGYTSLHLLEEKCPDICLMDIGMPGMTGIEVVAAARQKGLDTRFVILSGYKDFEYARKAIRNDVEDYLLKPVEELDLVSTIERICRDLDKQRRSRFEGGQSDRAHLYCSLLGLGPGKSEHSTDWAERIVAAGYDQDKYQLLRLFMPLSGGGKLQGWLEERNFGFLLDDWEGMTILLTKPIGRSYEKDAFDRDLGQFCTRQNYSLDGVCGAIYEDISDFSESALEELGQIASRRFFNRRKGLAYRDELMPVGSPDQDLSEALSESSLLFRQSIELGEYDYVHEQLLHHFEQSIQDEQSVKDFLSELTIAVIESIRKHHSHIRCTDVERAVLLSRIQSSRTVVAALETLSTFFKTNFPPNEFFGSDILYRKMCLIIQRHYSENLKIKDLSKILNYNSAYLGKLFKNECGESFNIYLDKTRIEKAKELLRQNMKVYQVAEAVGYKYVDYFHAKFKKYAGMSPLDYRRSTQSQAQIKTGKSPAVED